MNERIRRAISPATWKATPDHHSPLEDAQGLFSGVLLVALGLSILQEGGLLVGSTAGLALIGAYATALPFGLVFFVINLPFYALAVGRMGWAFTLKTFASVALLSVMTLVLPDWLDFARIAPVFGAVLAGVLMGFGLLAMFRHRASLGGVGILAFYCQERFGWRAGLVQLAVDLGVLALAPLVIEGPEIALSVLAAVVMNLFLAVNYRADRYIAR